MFTRCRLHRFVKVLPRAFSVSSKTFSSRQRFLKQRASSASRLSSVKGDKDSIQRLLDLPDNERPALLVFDLNNLNAKPLILIPKFRSKLKKATSIVGFLSHLQGDLKAKAVEAGCDTVMPRSAFSQSLPNLLRRYGVEEEEEFARQPM